MQTEKAVHPIRDVVFLVIFCAVFFMLFLGVHPLQVPEEATYASVAWGMVSSHQYLIPKLNGVPFFNKPILYYWFEALSMKCFGVNAWGIRIPAVFFGVLGCVAVYFTGYKVWNRKVGMMAALILATSPLYFIAVHFSNMNIEGAVWLSMGLFAFLLSQAAYDAHSGKVAYEWTYVSFVCGALACLTIGVVGILLPLLIVLESIVLTHRWSVVKKLHLLSGVVLFLAITLPWFVWMQYHEPHFWQIFYNQEVGHFLRNGSMYHLQPWWFYLAILLIGFLPWSLLSLHGLWFIKTGWNTRVSQYRVFFIAAWVVTLLVIYSLPDSKMAGYILPAVPPLALWIAVYIDHHWKHPWIFRGLVVVMVVVNVGLLIWSVPQDSRSHLDLANQVKPLLTPKTAVVSYYNYYPDLPLYFQRQMKVVGDWNDPASDTQDFWMTQFAPGIAIDPSTRQWMITESDLLILWQAPQPLIVFSSEADARVLSENLIPAPSWIGEENGVVALSNKPLLPSARKLEKGEGSTDDSL